MSEANNFVLKRIGTYDLTGNRLGKGNFAYVELATNRVTKTKVAMKVIDTRKIKDEYVKKNILREAMLLKKVNHPNIVRLYETLKQHSIYCIVTEFVPGGELLSHLRSQNDSKLNESQARPIMRQLISALYHMHEQGIVHRDLKLENILLDETKKNIKIVDFGLSNICRGDNLLKTQCGSPEYAAPELFRRGCRYGTEVDLWSLGVIMYGIVVGRLPFRSPHFGSAGRNELIDQTSRGLSCTHNKFLVLLTPDCRDLLRRLLEPRPEMRLPLLDVMVHPWVTVQGTASLVPYTEPPIEEKLWDKVLEKSSQLIKIDKSKITLHVHQKRYDAITGVFNLLLDEELKRASNNHRKIPTQGTQGNSVIQISIKSITSEKAGDQNGAQDTESRSASGSEKQASQPEAEQGWEQDSKRNEHPVETPIEGLQIRGRRIGSKEARFPNNRPLVKTRPNTAIPIRTPVESVSPKSSVGAARAWNRAGRARCKSCIPRFAPKFDSGLRGKRVIMSPRVRQEPEVLVSQWESKLKALLTDQGKQGSIHSDNAKISASTAEGNSSTKANVDIPSETSDARLKHAERTEGSSDCSGPNNCHSRDTPRVKQSSETSTSEGNTGQTSQTSPTFVNSKGWTCSHKGILPSSLATQTVNRAVSPLKTCKFVDLADYHKHIPQPPKARITRQLDGGSKLMEKDTEDEQNIDSFSATYQSYITENKPYHRRLSIIQAQDILRHESKFHTKYSRKSANENSSSNADLKLSEKQTSRFSHASIDKPITVHIQKKPKEQHHYNIPEPGYLKGVCLLADQREKLHSGLKREENVENNIIGPNPSLERILHEDNPIKDDPEKRNESRMHTSETDSNRPDTRLNAKQEESLKRQKEKEQTENYEREIVKFRKELEDQERQKIISGYLQHVYSQYEQTPSPYATNKKPEFNSRSYKVTRQGRVYSAVITRPSEKQGCDSQQVIHKATPILHNAARGTQGDKRIAFRSQTGVKSVNGVRFFNDWNNSVFTEYINSSEGNTAEGKGKDKLQTKDASLWLEQHLNGVLDETAVTGPQLHNYQQLIPRET